MGEARRHKPARPKRGFMDCYERPDRQYNPHVEGYGDPDEWRKAFVGAMGFEEAQAELDAHDPLVILGLPVTATWDDVRKAFRIKAMACHPDRAHLNNMSVHEATEAFKTLTAAYVVLERRYGQA